MFAKDASNLASFYGSDIDGIVCVKHIGLGLASSDFNFTVTSWFLGNVCIKPYLQLSEGGK